MSNFIDFAPEQVCYVHCHYCNTILAVSVPCSSLFNIVTVRCGHCTNLLPVNMAAMLQQAQSFSATPHDYMLDFATPSRCNKVSTTNMMQTTKDHKEDPITINRPPEKRQRVPSAYNQFIKEEIQRIKASNPDISHREAFSTAAKNWAHFPHIHFGLMMENKQDKFDDSTGKMLLTKTAICNK